MIEPTVSPAVLISKALYEAIKAGEFSREFDLRRSYLPIVNFDRMCRTEVIIVPVQVDGTQLNRLGVRQEEYLVDVAVFHKLRKGSMTNDERNELVDPLVSFVDEIGRRFANRELELYPEASCTGWQTIPLYSPKELEEKSLFASVARFTYEVFIL